MLLWTVVRNPLCCWGPLYHPRRRGGVRDKEKTAMCCVGVCDLAGVGRRKLPSSDGRGLLSQANLERRMAIRTVLWNPSYFTASFHRPRHRGFFSSKNGVVL